MKWIAAQIDLLDQRDRCSIALSGGSTPASAYSLLGQERLPWDRVDVVLGDERWVAADDASSNAGMLRRTLISDPGLELRPPCSIQCPPWNSPMLRPVPRLWLTSFGRCAQRRSAGV